MKASQKKLTCFVSEIDQFLAVCRRKAVVSSSQQKEVAKYQRRIFKLRDRKQTDVSPKSLSVWKEF